MKPLHIGLLVIAGALGGAIVMKVAQGPKHETPPAVAQQPAPPAPAAAPVPPAPAPAETAALPAEASSESAPVTRKPSPWKKPAVKVRHTPPPANPRPTTLPVTAQAEPPAPIVTPPVNNTPEPAREVPAPEPAAPARPEPEPVAPPPPEPNRVTLNAGTLIPVRLVEGLSTERNTPGDVFTATLDRALVVDGFVIAERGARVDGRVVEADRGGKVRGVSSLAVELTRIRTSDGQNIAVQTDSFERQAQSSRSTDAAKVGGVAAIGAVIGAIAGGGKGAAIGAGVGGAAGAGDVLLTRGKPATLPSETRIDFRLHAPVTVTERR